MHTRYLRIYYLTKISVPAGVVALVLLFLCMPKDFPYQGQRITRKAPRLGTVDGVGAALMLIGIILLITGFEEASDFLPWASAQVLAPILVAIPVLVAFFCYERFITLHESKQTEPVFPWRFCRNRVIMGIFM